MIRNLLARRRKSTAIPRDPVSRSGAGPVCGIPEFERALTRHYARADRTGRPFTLLVMHLDRLPREQRWAAAEAASRLARATDHVGWVSGTTRLGAILYDCRNDRAERLRNELCLDAGIRAEDVRAEALLYPGPVPAELEYLLPERKPKR